MAFFGKRRNASLIDQQVTYRANAQKAENRKKRSFALLKIVLLIILGIFILNLLFWLPSLYQRLSKPFKNIQTDYYLDNDLNFAKRTNLLLISTQSQALSELALASLEPGKKKITIVKISPKTQIFGKYGQLTLGELAAFDKNGIKNIDSVSFAVIEILGYIPDGYLLIKDTDGWVQLDTLDKLVAQSSLNPTIIFKINDYKKYMDEHLMTNLNLNQMYKLTSLVKKIQPERFEIIDASGYLTETGFLDSTLVKNKIGVTLHDYEVVRGDYAVEITNASQVEGLGSVVKNVVANLGANVVSIDSVDDVEQETKVYYKEKNYFTDRVSKFFGVKGEKQESLATDMSIVVGEDFGELFSF